MRSSPLWLLIVSALTVLRSVAQPTTEPDESERYQPVAFWYGHYVYHGEQRTEEMSVQHELGLTEPHMKYDSTVNCVLREEVDITTGVRRTVLQDCSWSGSISDLYYIVEDARIPAGSGGSRGGTIAEGDNFLSPMDPSYVKRIEGEFEDAKQKFADAKAALDASPKDEEAKRLFYLSEYKFNELKREIELIKHPAFPAGISGGTTMYTDPATGKNKVAASIVISRDLYKFKFEQLGRPPTEKKNSFKLQHVAGEARMLDSTLKLNRYGADIRGEMKGDSGTISESEKGNNGLWSWSETFTRVALADKPIVIRGTVMHRLRCTENASYIVGPLRGDESFAEPKDGAGDDPMMEGVFPVDGHVIVDAWILSDKEATPPTREPDLATLTTTGGRFELYLPRPDPKQYVWLRFTYYNRDAQFTETSELEVAAAELLQLQASAISIGRHNFCTVRYAQQPRTFDLGGEMRGGVERFQGKLLSLNFDGPFSIFMNTWCMRAQHVNQNMQTFQVTVPVPRQRLIDLCPSFVNKNLVKQRLGFADKTTASLCGGEICFPSSTLMALSCLELEKVPEGKTALISELGQAIFDYRARHDALNNKGQDTGSDDPTAPPWLLGKLADAKTLSEALNSSVLDPFTRRLYDAVWLDASKPFYEDWPYIDERNDCANEIEPKKWLVTCTGDFAGYRPWQTIPYSNSAMKQRYPGQIDFEVQAPSKDYNVFDPKNTGFILRQLSLGCPATVSIRHRNASNGEGGHVLCLLGAIVKNDGTIQRLIFHDPYGDLTQHPDEPGYYDRTTASRQRFDYDRTEHRGAYAPYGPDVFTYHKPQNSFQSKWMNVFVPVGKTDVFHVRSRILPAQGPPPASNSAE